MTAAAAPPTTHLMQFILQCTCIASLLLGQLTCVGGSANGVASVFATPASRYENDQQQQQHETDSQFTVEHLMLSTDNVPDILHLVFQPSLLDFHELAVGDADSDVVTVFNKHANRSVFLGSITGKVPDFYSSFFEEKVIPPMGNTTFNVVFLPRQQGAIQTDLQIHTSFGIILYTLKGKGVECLFRLNPLVGLRAPFNATLTPEILMYNPYSTPLQILEVYSSGGQFQLELPSGGPEGPQALWLIPPFTTKPVIRVRFKATAPPGNYTAYIRIKVTSENNYELEDVVLVVPIEVEITPEHGIYSEVPFVDFGLAGNKDKPKKLVFRLLNSGQDPIDVDEFTVEACDDVSAAISVQVDREPTQQHPNTGHLITATVDWSKLKTERYFKGHIRIKAHHQFNNNRITIHRIPFVGEIIVGFISYNESHTRFVTSTKPTKAGKEFRLKNNFSVALAVNDVSLNGDSAKYFKTNGFVPRILEPGEEAPLFKIAQLTAASKKPIEKALTLHTNASAYEIPLLTYNGLLRRVVPVDETTINGIGLDERSINYGTLPLSTVTDTVLALVNDSPVPVTIHNWTATISDVASIFVILRGCGNLTTENLKFCYTIQPKEWILFQVSVLSNAVGSFAGKLTVKTDFEELLTPVRFTTAMGRLQFSATMLDEGRCYPGGLCSVNLTAYSTFQQPMSVKEIIVNVTGITYDYSNSDFPAIAPNEQTHIGQLQFSPKSICGEECYLEFPDNWAPSVISTNCKNKERDLMFSKLEAFRIMRASFSSISFRVQTNHVRRYDFNGSATLIWPKLVESSIFAPIIFPTRLAGENVTHEVLIHNPTEHPIKVYLTLHDVTQMGTSMTLPPEIISFCWDCFLSRESTFSLLGVDSLKRSGFYIIQPLTPLRVSIRFQTQNPGTYSNLLYIRNNFTVLEATWLTATARPHHFKFGNRRPGSDLALNFDLNEKNVRSCDEALQHLEGAPILMTTKRTFTAKNTGDEPVEVFGMYINGLRCEGFGFKVLDCWHFRLPPNTSKKIEILFTSDFTLAKITRLLTIETSLDYAINYTMESMIPAHVLTNCSKVLRRPEWEYSLHIITFGVLAISFVLVLFVAYIDAEKVLKDHVHNMSKDKGPAEPTLDLREIGMRGSAITSFDDVKSDISLNGSGGSCNGSAMKPFAYLRKKPTIVRKQEVEVLTTADAGPKKSWAIVLARKFSPIKSDVKFRDSIPPLPTSKSRAETNKPVNKKQLTRDVITALMDASNTKTIEDDASSTTTETSMQSSSDASSEKKQSSPSRKQTNGQHDRSPPAVVDPPKSKLKNSVKKTKSLPLSNSQMVKEDLLPIPGPVVSKQMKVGPVPAGSINVKNPSGRSGPIPASVITTENIKRHSDGNGYAGNQQAANSSQNDSEKNTSNQKKYGKTPGRERRKQDTLPIPPGSAARKVTSPKLSTATAAGTNGGTYKGTAFQFTSPLTNSPGPVTTTSSPIWEINKISFSNIVAQNPYSPDLPLSSQSNTASESIVLPSPTALTSTPIAPNSSGPPLMTHKSNAVQNLYGKLSAKSLFRSFNNQLDDPMIDETNIGSLENDTFKPLENLNEEMLNDDIHHTGVDLGPIGTRKSPSHTPIWEPMPSIQKPVAINAGVGNPNSFFSEEFQPYTGGFNSSGSSGTEPMSNIDLAGVAGLFDSVYGQHLTQQERVWDPSTLISFLHQKQLQLQQQQIQKKNESAGGQAELRHQQHHPQLHQQLNNQHLNQLLQHQQQQQQQMPPSIPTPSHQQQQQTNMHNLYSSNTSALWGSTYTQPGWNQGPNRPPPGLEQRQQLPRMQQQHLQHQPLQFLQQERLNHMAQNGSSATDTIRNAGGQQFDLFSGSMSAIWSQQWTAPNSSDRSATETPPDNNNSK